MLNTKQKQNKFPIIMGSTANAARISSIRTYALVAWVFSIIINVVWTLAFLFFVGIVLLELSGVRMLFGVIVLFYLIILLVFLIPSIMVMRRAGRLYGAAKRADVQELKAIDSVAWGIVALIFTGVVPGIMLLVAHGPISELGVAAAGDRLVLEEDSISKLERLKTLLDEGVINQDEFEQQKRKILGPASQADTPEEQLRRLKQLLDSGAITEAEFEAQKKQILSKL